MVYETICLHIDLCIECGIGIPILQSNDCSTKLKLNLQKKKLNQTYFCFLKRPFDIICLIFYYSIIFK